MMATKRGDRAATGARTFPPCRSPAPRDRRDTYGSSVFRCDRLAVQARDDIARRAARRNKGHAPCSHPSRHRPPPWSRIGRERRGEALATASSPAWRTACRTQTRGRRRVDVSPKARPWSRTTPVRSRGSCRFPTEASFQPRYGARADARRTKLSLPALARDGEEGRDVRCRQARRATRT